MRGDHAQHEELEEEVAEFFCNVFEPFFALPQLLAGASLNAVSDDCRAVLELRCDQRKQARNEVCWLALLFLVHRPPQRLTGKWLDDLGDL